MKVLWETLGELSRSQRGCGCSNAKGLVESVLMNKYPSLVLLMSGNYTRSEMNFKSHRASCFEMDLVWGGLRGMPPVVCYLGQ